MSTNKKASDSHPALELRHVTIRFGDQTILSNVNLTVQHHETIVLIGPSGDGKTVLLKTMAGVIAPSEGIVLVEGEDWQSLESEAKHDLAQKIGMLFQKSALFDSLNAKENVAFPLREHTQMSEDEIDERVSHFLEAVGLADAHEKFPHELSGGMQRRLGIARALALNPEIIFYDDPTAGQDPITSDKIAELILELKEKNKSTVVAVTNDILRAYQLADRIFLVAAGEVIEAGTVEQTKSHPDPRIQQFIHGRLEGPLKVKV